MTKSSNQEVVEELFERLQREFGNMAPKIITIIVEIAGGQRLTFPDLQYLYREERNRRIRNEFTGFNYEELSIKYRLKCRQVRKIIQNGALKCSVISSA